MENGSETTSIWECVKENFVSFIVLIFFLVFLAFIFIGFFAILSFGFFCVLDLLSFSWTGIRDLFTSFL